MSNVIVACSKAEDARNIKNILVKNGFQVVAVCSSGAQVLACAEDLSSGILVCSYRLTDMISPVLREDLSARFSMLMISSPARWGGSPMEDLVCLPTPLKVHDLISTLEMMEERQYRQKKKRRQQPVQRSKEEKGVVEEAKRLLMERNAMTEEEAHRYIQKHSMDRGTNMTETARMVISLITL